MSPAPPSAALIVTVKHASEPLSFVKLYVWKNFVPGKPLPGQAFPLHPLGDHRVRVDRPESNPMWMSVPARLLVRATRARWYDNRDSLASIREGEVQFKLYLRSAGE